MFVAFLPEEVRKLISAGEVIESPADCVKELVENSLDAGAQRIEVEITKGGKNYISVKDDGSGIHPEDIDKVVLEYTTSKIRSIEDLSYLQTYGFRGEALHAISRVSKLVISSRFRGEKLGYQLRVEGGEIVSKREIGMQEGTKVEVYDLFYNVPVRQKFLKKEETEKNKVLRIVKEYAIARPDVHFIFISNAREVFNLPRVNNPKQRLEMFFNSPFDEFEKEENGIKVKLLLSVDTGKSEVHVFVNSRPVYNQNLAEHVRKLVGEKKIGICFIEIPPYMIDFNIHPKKKEIKIYKERFLFSLFSGLVKNSKSVNLSPLSNNGVKEREFKEELIGVINNTIAIYQMGDFLYFFDIHLLSERLNYEEGDNPTTACKNAVKAGEQVSKEEIERLIKKWKDFENPQACPHGRPIYYKMYLGELYKKVGRVY